MNRLEGKVVVLTGAARGIGRVTAAECAAQGADLVLLDICADLPGVPYPLGTPGQLEHTAQLCRDQGAAVLTAAVDVRDPAAVGEAVTRAVDRFGRVDVVVNNAGIAAPSGKPVHEISEDEWALMLDVDLSGAWRLIRAVGKRMCEQRSGSIVNVASTAGLVGYRHFAGYVAAKHGIVGLTKATALESATSGVTVNAICPGWVLTPLVQKQIDARAAQGGIPVEQAQRELLGEKQPSLQFTTPEQLGELAVFLCSPAGDNVKGVAWAVDGGWTAQ